MAIKTFQLVYSEAEFDRYFKFSFVRNPWDRLASAFHFLKRGGLTAADARWAQSNLADFSEFDHFVREWVSSRNVNSWQHFKPQHRFVCDPSGRTQIDFLGRFENLDEDFAHIAERLELPASLDHYNRTTGSDQSADYRSHYSPESRAIVASVYRRDIELFGYEFDRVEGPSHQPRP